MIYLKKEFDNFIVESDKKLDYFDEIVNHILENEKRILNFFKLKKLPKKVKIMILSYEPFKEFIISKYGEILSYMSGDSDQKTNTIRILNIEDQIKYTIHKSADVTKIKGTVLHEIIHECHHTYHNECQKTIWFSEGLATNLSYQKYELKCLDDCDFKALQGDFRQYPKSYNYSYTIVKYVLDNYSMEEIEKLYKDLDYLIERSQAIFEEARIWVGKNTN